jgi:hypothetical protein
VPSAQAFSGAAAPPPRSAEAAAQISPEAREVRAAAMPPLSSILFREFSRRKQVFSLEN